MAVQPTVIWDTLGSWLVDEKGRTCGTNAIRRYRGVQLLRELCHGRLSRMSPDLCGQCSL